MINFLREAIGAVEAFWGRLWDPCKQWFSWRNVEARDSVRRFWVWLVSPRRLSTLVRRQWRKQSPREFRRMVAKTRQRRFLDSLLSGRAGELWVPFGALCIWITIVVLASSSALPAWFQGGQADRQFLNTLWQVEVGLLSVTFALAVLLVQLRSDKGADFRFASREAGVGAVVSLGLTLVFLGGFSEFLLIRTGWFVEVLSPVVRLLWVYLVMFLLENLIVFRTVVNLTTPSTLRKRTMQSIQEELILYVEGCQKQALARRFFEDVCREHHLEYSLFAGLRNDLTPVKAGKSGIVADIRLRKLARFAGKPGGREVADSDAERTLLLAAPGDGVSVGSVLARVHTQRFGEDRIRLLQAAYVLAESKGGANDDRATMALDAFKGQALSVLHQYNAQPFREVLDQYYEVFERTQQVLGSAEMSSDSLDSSPWGFGRTVVSRLVKDLGEIQRAAIRTGETDFINLAMYAPIRVLHLLPRFHEPTLFRDLCRLSPAAYHDAVGASPSTRQYVTRKCWWNLEELGCVYLASCIDSDSVTADTRSWCIEYVVELLLAYSVLLKLAADHGDQDAFTLFGESIDRLLKGLNLGRALTEYEFAGWRLQDSETRREDREFAEAARERYAPLLGLSDTRQAVWFGISAWLFRQIRRGEVDSMKARTMLTRSSEHFSNLEDLSSVFFTLISHDRSRFHSMWEDWGTPPEAMAPAGMGYNIDTKTWLRAFYCLRGLQLIPDDLAEDASGTPIPYRSEVADQLRNLGSVCDGLVEDDSIKHLMPKNAGERIERFLELHNRAAKTARRVKEHEILATSANPELIEAFFADFVDTLQGTTRLRVTLEEFGVSTTERYDGEEDPGAGCGLDRLLPKECFIGVTDSMVIGPATGYVTQLVRCEDLCLYEGLTDQRIQCRECSFSHLVECCEQAVQSMRDAGLSPSLMLTSPAVWKRGKVVDELRKAVVENTDWSEVHPNGYMGSLLGIPVLRIGVDFPSEILIGDFPRLGHIVHKIEDGSEGGFEFSVEQFDAKKAAELVSSGNAEKLYGISGEDAERQLQQLVRVRIWEHCRFQVTNPEAAVLIRVLDEKHEEESE